MPFPFKSTFYLKNQGTIQIFHTKSINYQSEHSFQSSKTKQLCLLQFKYVLMGQPDPLIQLGFWPPHNNELSNAVQKYEEIGQY